MDRVPPEIRENIIQHLLDPDDDFLHPIAQYTPISRAWQLSFEHHTFDYIQITSDEIGTFEGLFTGSKISRREELRSLDVTFLLPESTYGVGCCVVADRVLEREADTISFSESVAKLFSVLADLERRADSHSQPLTLRLYARRSSEPRIRALVPCSGEEGHHSQREVAEAIANPAIFGLRHQDQIAPLKHIKKLTIEAFGILGDLEPSSIAEISKKTPCLEIMNVHAEDLYYWGRNRRIEWREGTLSHIAHRSILTCVLGISAAISSLPTSHLRHLTLSVAHEAMLNENLQPHKLSGGGQMRDEAWSSLLKHISTELSCLSSLDLLGGLVISPEFFQSITEGSFLSLTELTVEFALETADGRWFFQRDEELYRRNRYRRRKDEVFQVVADPSCVRSRDRNTQYSFGVFGDGPLKTHMISKNINRTVPDKTTLFPLLMDSANAVRQLPHLRKFILKLKGWSPEHSRVYPVCIEPRVFELWFLRSGMPRSRKGETGAYSPRVPSDAKYIRQNRLYWRVDTWTPWQEVQAAWSGIAGPQAKTIRLEEDKWDEDDDWDGPIYFGDF